MAVCELPQTDEKVLFANQVFCEELVENTFGPVQNLYTELISRPLVLHHRWKPGDLLVFDNFRYWHAGSILNSSQSKHLQKVHIGRLN